MDFRRLGCAIGGRVGRGGQPVLRGDEDDIAAHALLLEGSERFPRDEEIPLGENVHVAVPHRQFGFVDRRRGRDSGIGDEDVDAAIFDSGMRIGQGDSRLVGHVELHGAHEIGAEGLGELVAGAAERRLVDVGEHDACTLAQQPGRGCLADAAGPAGHEGDLSGQRFRLRQALQLGFFQKPVFNVERLLRRQADIARNR